MLKLIMRDLRWAVRSTYFIGKLNTGDTMKSEDYVVRTQKLLEEIKQKQKLDFSIVKIEYVNEDGINYLRVYADMDKEGGIGVDDCAAIARPLSKALDKADFIADDNYTLEVCSPGFLEPAQTEPDENMEEEDNE